MKIPLAVLFFTPVYSLLDFVTDNNRWNEKHLLNVVSFSKDAIEYLEVTAPDYNSFKDKKRAFFKFCEIYGHDNRTAIVGLINQLAHVYNGIPDNFQKLGKSVFDNFVNGKYTFDIKTLEEIGKRFDEEYANGNLMEMWNSKNAFDRHLKTFKKIFYSPIRSGDLEKEDSEVGKKIINLVLYIFGEDVDENLQNQPTKEEL